MKTLHWYISGLFIALLYVYLLAVQYVRGASSNIDFNYHNHEEMTSILNNLNQQYPDLTALYSVGKSVEGTVTNTHFILLVSSFSYYSLSFASFAMVHWHSHPHYYHGYHGGNTTITLQSLSLKSSHPIFLSSFHYYHCGNYSRNGCWAVINWSCLTHFLWKTYHFLTRTRPLGNPNNQGSVERSTP